MTASSATIQNGKVVNLAYQLTSDEGEVLDRADARDPFVYMHGASQIVPGLELALEGKKVGDKAKIAVGAKDGYGEVDPSLKMAVDRAQFPKDVELELGMQFETFTADGESVIFTVEEFKDDKILVDGNHPLAGKTLHFEIEVLGVRDATAEEKSHGHAHGPDGHHHH